jgi:hypothetical protein
MISKMSANHSFEPLSGYPIIRKIAGVVDKAKSKLQ